LTGILGSFNRAAAFWLRKLKVRGAMGGTYYEASIGPQPFGCGNATLCKSIRDSVLF
jgi:hypothetical protein